MDDIFISAPISTVIGIAISRKDTPTSISISTPISYPWGPYKEIYDVVYKGAYRILTEVPVGMSIGVPTEVPTSHL